VGRASARFIPLAGARRILATVDDVTDQHLLEVERTAGIGSYRAVAEAAKLLLAGHSPVESIASVIPTVRRTGGLSSVLLWNLERQCPQVVDGEPPPEDLGEKLRHGEPLPDGNGVRLGGPDPAAGSVTGWAVPLTPTGHTLILLTSEPLPWTTEALYVEVLTDLATFAANSARGKPD
jgi:hypothetical protein